MGHSQAALLEILRMGAPAIALRFRDTTLGIDTIASHRKIIQAHGSAWWGWWKKNFEDGQEELLRQLNAKVPIRVLIIDRLTCRMFSGNVIEVRPGAEGVDTERVPAYYKKQASRVHAWFRLTEISDIEFQEEIANRFGDLTLIDLGTTINTSRDKKVAASAETPGKSSVLHLSDLHFGKDYGFIAQGARREIGDPKVTLTDCLVADLTRIKLLDDIATVVVTGDFTTEGDWSDTTRKIMLNEFEALRSALQLSAQQIVVVPGNHDVVRYSSSSQVDVVELTVEAQTTYQHEREFRTFVDELIGRSWKESLNYVRRFSLASCDLIFCLLNSCTIAPTKWTEYGFVGSSGLDAIASLRKEEISRPTFKVMALHHHILPVVDVDAPESRGVTLTLDASKLLDAAQEAGVHLILHGHQHFPRISNYRTIPLSPTPHSAPPTTPSAPLCVVSNGSTGGRRLPIGERNTYCVFTADENDISMCMRELKPSGKEGPTLFQGALNLSAQSPAI